MRGGGVIEDGKVTLRNKVGKNFPILVIAFIKGELRGVGVKVTYEEAWSVIVANEVQVRGREGTAGGSRRGRLLKYPSQKLN